MPSTANPLARLGNLLRDEKSEISAVYFYALLSGLIQLSLPLGIQSIIGFVLGGAMSTSLVVLIIIVVLGVACNGLLQLSQMRLIERIQQKVFVRYSFAFTHHLPRLNLQGLDSYYLPELVNRFFDIPILQKSLSKILLDFPIAITQILLGLLLLSFYHPAFIAFGFFLLLILTGIFFITGNRGFQTSLEKSSHKYSVAAWLEEMARVIKQFKFFRHTGLHADRSDKRITSYLDARTAHFRILLLQYKVLIAFKVLITAAMLIVGCFLLLEQQINIGQFVAAEIVIIIVINSVEKLIVNLDSVYSALTSVEKINKLLDKPVEKEGSFTVDRVPLSLQLTNISFGYDSESPILNKLSFTLPAGEKLGMQGPNGSGKSTLLRLLTGAYTGFTGSLLINEAPIGNYDLQSLRANTGIVLSQEDIFAGTLWENLTMNNQHLDRSYVLELCRRTGLQAFVTTLKEGFDTELHPGGRQLSRGIIQRILLVRAMASKPGLLLLEEPMAGIEGADSDSIRELILSLPNTTVVAATNNTDFLNGCQHRISLLPNVSGQ